MGTRKNNPHDSKPRWPTSTGRRQDRSEGGVESGVTVGTDLQELREALEKSGP